MSQKETSPWALEETSLFLPPKNFTKEAYMNDPLIYQKAKEDPQRFWASLAEQELKWEKKWSKILEWDPPFAKWFIGGKLNASVNCLDRHLDTPRRNKVALFWEGENGEKSTLTYYQLYENVCRLANVLKDLGIKKGDRVAIYLPMIPEAVIAMLACARIGAPHNVVFGGFSAEALRERINDAGARLLITADGSYRRGKVIPLKENTDEALEETPTIEKTIVVRRTNEKINMVGGRDFYYDELVAKAKPTCEAEIMDAEDMLFLLYTSGTTGKPKGIVHTTGGYLLQTHVTSKWVFDLKDTDIYWCTADIGWITGHSYIVYGPLSVGATEVIYEGAPDYPDKDRWWDIIERYRVSILYTAPTSIRACMRWGEEYPKRHDLSSLRLLGSVGEPINPEAWLWYYRVIGREKCPISDTWWQTETGGHMITPLPALTTLKPGSATFPFPGIDADVVDDEGQSITEKEGYLVIKSPWPGMLRTIYGDEERYKRTYWSKYNNKMYFSGDGARRDADGYIWVLGRVDDVINVSGHRLSTMEIESVLISHTSVAEAAVIGRSHKIKGQALTAFITLKDTVNPSYELAEELKQYVAKKLGNFAKPEDLIFAKELPKTRSGKILRRLLRDIAEKRALGDTTTLADEAVVVELQKGLSNKE